MQSSVSLAIGAALSILLVAPALVLAQASPALPPSFQFSSSAASLCVPIEVIANGLVFAHVEVNGHPRWFIVDNGSQGFLVDGDYAQRNSLQTNGSAVTWEVGSDAGLGG